MVLEVMRGFAEVTRGLSVLVGGRGSGVLKDNAVYGRHLSSVAPEDSNVQARRGATPSFA